MKKILRHLAPCIIGLLSYALLATLVLLFTEKDIHHWVYTFFKRLFEIITRMK